jgi:hypothetical protein
MNLEGREKIKESLISAMNDYLQQEDPAFRIQTDGEDENGKEWIRSKLKQEEDGENLTLILGGLTGRVLDVEDIRGFREWIGWLDDERILKQGSTSQIGYYLFVNS